MSIERVEVFVLKSPLEQPFAFSQGRVRQRAATLVRITTDEGVEGWGEAFAQGLEPPEIAAATIEHALKPLLVGADPEAPGVLWHRMYNACRDFGRKGSVIAAISAIDIALWDILGHIHARPVHALLGGAHRASVQPYATGFYRLEGRGESARLAAEACAHREAGFRAMKVKLGFGIDDDLSVMGAIGEALAGSAVTLMVDTNHAYGRREALALGRALEPYALRWYEEPVVAEDIAGYAELRARLDVPIAGGENEHTAYGFAELIGRGGVDVAQPDLASCGGFSAARDIAAIAQAHGVMVNPHVWGTAIAQAASLQLIAALPVAHHSFAPLEPILEFDRSAHPFRAELLSEPCAIVDGRVPIPCGPGLGIEVRMDTVERYSSR